MGAKGRRCRRKLRDTSNQDPKAMPNPLSSRRAARAQPGTREGACAPLRYTCPNPFNVSMIPSICSVRFGFLRPKRVESCSGVAVGSVARSWRIRVTWAGSRSGQMEEGLMILDFGFWIFDGEEVVSVPGRLPWVGERGSLLRFWYSGRSQRIWPRFSSAARAWLRATRRVRSSCSGAAFSRTRALPHGIYPHCSPAMGDYL